MKFNIKKLALVAGALAGLMSVTAFAGSSSGGASAAGGCLFRPIPRRDHRRKVRKAVPQRQ